MLADAVVVEQPVPVAEVDAFRDGVHGLMLFTNVVRRHPPFGGSRQCGACGIRGTQRSRAADLRQHGPRLGSGGAGGTRSPADDEALRVAAAARHADLPRARSLPPDTLGAARRAASLRYAR